MEPTSLSANNAPEPAHSESSGLVDTAFERMQTFLKAKDDTSRFVGLALLKSVLDNDGQLVHNADRVRIIWESLSPKFFDRLLRAHGNDKLKKSDAQDMVDLAVSVLHTFSIILPEASKKEKRLTGRTHPLVKALVESPAETTQLILQTVATITSQPEGALEMLNFEDTSPLTEIALQHPLVLDILGFTWINASTIESKALVVQARIDKTMPILLKIFEGTDAVTLLAFAETLLSSIPQASLPPNPKWVGKLIKNLRGLVISKPTLAGRSAYTQLAATLLQLYPTICPELLFMDKTSHEDKKPFSYLFVNLLLIDLRSSFPTLLELLNSEKYPTISRRLAAAFDIVSSFTGFLVKSLDENAASSTFSMPPDLLLKLRKDIAETMSLTIEYLRDRWDASIAGASGLHPSARAGTAATSEGKRLTITWESMTDSVNTDMLILSAIRTLAIWIREDENENLRNESAGLMDMFIELYQISSHKALDFRYPILLALEGIMTTEDGVDNFLGQDGWKALSEDLDTILRRISDGRGTDDEAAGLAARGLEIIRVLLAVVDHPTTHLLEDWIPVVKATTSLKSPSSSSPAIIIEVQIAMLQLSTALLANAAGGVQKRYVTSNAALSGLTQQLKKIVAGMDDGGEAAEFFNLLEGVALDLENLGMN
ncbi:Neurochondrin-domain-containing protein [Bisporella sp. PMI_857]|nr:Neurochondrin-domain-containing protein [Bisporella sp. PMI_857]